MNSHSWDQYRRQLLASRERITGEVRCVEEAVCEDGQATGGFSSVPVHIADLAAPAIDADLQVLAVSHHTLGEIDAALARIEAGTYGVCCACGRAIRQDRLEAIPYAARCVHCAEEADEA